mmetsp:Transcript_44351/g.123304  ORF Transcript_44351/g.123304 Transcript_44351/m.123304 type:complete len:219 (-) Transcript_44351:586-1242(-)
MQRHEHLHPGVHAPLQWQHGRRKPECGVSAAPERHGRPQGIQRAPCGGGGSAGRPGWLRATGAGAGGSHEAGEAGGHSQRHDLQHQDVCQLVQQWQRGSQERGVPAGDATAPEGHSAPQGRALPAHRGHGPHNHGGAPRPGVPHHAGAAGGGHREGPGAAGARRSGGGLVGRARGCARALLRPLAAAGTRGGFRGLALQGPVQGGRRAAGARQGLEAA